jgi:hypothetical protein
MSFVQRFHVSLFLPAAPEHRPKSSASSVPFLIFPLRHKQLRPMAQALASFRRRYVRQRSRTKNEVAQFSDFRLR